MSESAINTMLASLSTATIRQYNKPLRLWSEFCLKKRICPFNAEISSIIEFLDLHLENINHCGTLNSYRSAISLITDKPIGDNHNIKRFCKGVSNLKPQTPKYDCTWDPSVVLSHLETLYPNENLSLDSLSKKFVTLLALITAQRVQTLAVIKLKDIVISENEAKIFISSKIKTSSTNNAQPVLKIPEFSNKKELCVFSILKLYLAKTVILRSKDCENLIITTKKPHNAASRDTIRNWIRKMLSDSGIDTRKFGVHSTRHAATSAALRNGASIEVIRKTAGWTRTSHVFARFYNLPLIDEPEFASCIV